MEKKPLNSFTLGMMNVAIVASLQMMTACAVYGSSLLLFYLIAVIAFYVPCLLIIAELATASPQTGGSYIWVEKAFGKQWGFFAVCLQWFSNLIWYPTIFMLISTSFAYLIDPDLATNKAYILTSMLALFWGITILNAFGIKISSLASSLSAIVGIILPTLILAFLGIAWIVKSGHSYIHFSWRDLLPQSTDGSQFAFLTQIMVSLLGLEMAVVHAGDVNNPRKSIPKALAFSALLILIIVIAAPISIAAVIPTKEIGVIGGLFDAFKVVFAHFSFHPWTYLLIVGLIFIGNSGSVTAWMISVTRGMHVASIECGMPSYFQKTNRFKAPLGILILEALLFSLFAVLFLYFETISNAYWILLTLTSQVSLIYYLLLFASAVKIKKSTPVSQESFKVPGGLRGTKIAAFLGSCATLSAITLGFFPPNHGTVVASWIYPFLLAGGIFFILCLPFALLKLRKKPEPISLT